MSEPSATSSQGESEPDLLSLFVVVAESWKLLLIAPLFAAASAVAISLLLSAKYESQAVLAIGKDATMITSANVLRTVIKKLNLQKELSPDLDQATKLLTKRMSLTRYGDSPNYLIELSASTPTLAQTTLNGIIDETYKQLRPHGQTLDRLKERLNALQTSSDRQQRYAELLVKGVGSPASGIDADVRAPALAAIENNILANQNEIVRLRTEIEGMGSEQTIMPATLPDRKQPLHTAAIAVLAALATSALLLLYVLARDAYRRGLKDPRTAAKMARIRYAISVRPRSN